MTDLFITTLFVSIIIALEIEILLVKSFHKSCLTGDKNLFLTVGMTFLGIHLLITFQGWFECIYIYHIEKMYGFNCYN